MEVKTMIQNKKGSDSIKIFRRAPQLTFSRRRGARHVIG
jgi:hypothetical protein